MESPHEDGRPFWNLFATVQSSTIQWILTMTFSIWACRLLILKRQLVMFWVLIMTIFFVHHWSWTSRATKYWLKGARSFGAMPTETSILETPPSTRVPCLTSYSMAWQWLKWDWCQFHSISRPTSCQGDGWYYQAWFDVPYCWPSLCGWNNCQKMLVYLQKQAGWDYPAQRRGKCLEWSPEKAKAPMQMRSRTSATRISNVMMVDVDAFWRHPWSNYNRERVEHLVWQSGHEHERAECWTPKQQMHSIASVPWNWLSRHQKDE